MHLYHNLPQTESAVILNTLCRFPIDTLIGAPTLFRMLVQNDLSKYRFMNLKYCISGGETTQPRSHGAVEEPDWAGKSLKYMARLKWE
ncbi:acyl-coenzyme A synthetase ACSM5, mitochondrial-like [Sylvia atricapilla]|uniref:acyl-coenzyme A synthetase ACSM5, mitochondrial-like n=1 Tax=Sylvia atricapilla TaxID=48155 RepID=UPI0033995DC3